MNVPLHAGDVLFADCESSGEDSVIIPSGPAVQIIYEDDYLLVVNHSVIESPSMRKESCLGNKMVE